MTESYRDDGCRQYREIRFTEDRAQLIGWIRQIVDEYEADGLSLTVRQIFYQAVSRDLLPNTGGSYARIQSAINDGRMAGLIPWTQVEDRGRSLMGLETWPSPLAATQNLARRYRRDLWEGQYHRPEVWVEKAALEGVVGDICNELRVDYYATRGYDSQSQQWRAGQRMARRIQEGQRPLVIHLADHDPSGIDMTRDVEKRLSLFAGAPILVRRIALNMDQVEQYDPPPNPTKESDSRSPEYQRLYGDSSWELDALEPRVLRALISDEVARWRDESLWSEALAEEVGDIRELREAAARMSGKAAEEGEDD